MVESAVVTADPAKQSRVPSELSAAAVGSYPTRCRDSVHDAATRNAAALPDNDATTIRLRSAFNTLSQELDDAEREDVCAAAVQESLALARQPERPVTSPDRSVLRLVLDLAAAVPSPGGVTQAATHSDGSRSRALNRPDDQSGRSGDYAFCGCTAMAGLRIGIGDR